MTTLLICPGERNSVPALSQHLPLSHVPVLGQTLLEYWLSFLAIQGAKKVTVLTHAAVELTTNIVGQGERWGLEAKVIGESRELTVAETMLKYATQADAAGAADSIIVLDHFPGTSPHPLFNSYGEWFAGLRGWMPSAITVDRVGVNEVQAGVWVGCHSHVSREAVIRPPCWIGQHVYVGARSVLGPGAIVEDGSFVEPGAELAESWVGPDTFVGQFARIRSSLAWGSTLVNWQTGSAAQVADQFLLCALRQPRAARSAGWFRKLSELYNRNKSDVGMLWKQLLLHRES